MRTKETTRNMRHAFVIVSLMLCVPATMWSQTAEWTVYNRANSGLPYNGVTAIAVDDQGTAWIGTGRWYAFEGGGLAKFDGQNWTVYNTVNSGLPNNDHTSLSIDPQGNVWSGTESGVSKFDGENWTVYFTSNSGLPNNQAGAPVFDNEGNAWIGTTGGLAKFDGVNWTVYNTSNSGLPNSFIWPYAFDGQGNLWIGTFGSGLAKFDGTDWTTYNTVNSGLPDNNLVSLTFDLQGNVWAGTLDNGVAKFDGTRWTAYNTANSGLPNNRIWYLAVDSNGSVWACTLAGLARFDGDNWTVYTTANSGLPDNNVYCVAFDADGAIWVGTQDGGLAVMRVRPTVDFNGDGSVDGKDVLILAAHWGTDDPICDIAPLPFGDGLVDLRDIVALAEYIGKEVNDPTLIAHWALDETEGIGVLDSAGNHPGYVAGTPAWEPDAGKIGGALAFDGATLVATGSVLSPNAGPFSVLAWIKGGGPGQVVVSQAGGADWLLADPATGALMTDLKDMTTRTPKALRSQTVMTDGDWHRVGLIWDGGNRMLYVDDVAVTADTQSDLPECDGGLCIGCGKDVSPGTFWSGLIDDVRIYDRAVRP
ncbi:MAG: hypothetical protein JW955_01045 [Sedimentisphaerales bacterium]|nr:hypothetical protein [Sedimentisphaerales bacterium]